MKHFFMVVGFLSSCMISADVKLGTVYNHSDLTVTHVSTLPNSKNKTLTNQVKLTNKQNQNHYQP